MKSFSWILALVAVVGLAGFAVAGEEAKAVTVSGKIVCAKCTLQKADAKECQNVLVGEYEGAQVEYYMVKNPVAEKFGHTCQGSKAAVVTGTLQKKDGKIWIEASKIEESKG